MTQLEERSRRAVRMRDDETLREVLRASEEHLRLALEGARLGSWERDMLTNKAVWNRRIYEMLGRDPEGAPINGETIFDYIHEKDLPQIRKNLEETLRTGTDFHHEFRIIREDGETRWLAASGRVYRGPEGRPVRMAGVNIDITERKHAEERLTWLNERLEFLVRERTKALEQEISTRKGYEEELKSSGERFIQECERRRYLSRHLVESLERERMNISRTLHDNIGQKLTVVLMKLGSLEKDAGLTEKTEEIRRGLKETMTELRDICHTLRPPVLDHFGLRSAIRSLIDSLNEGNEGTNPTIRFFSNEIPGRLDETKELAIYRICQEALTNIIKHAQAKNVYVNLIKKDSLLILTVEDDGKGFEYPASTGGNNPQGSLGIMIMRERAAQVEGRFRIESGIGKGTQVTVEIPVEG